MVIGWQNVPVCQAVLVRGKQKKRPLLMLKKLSGDILLHWKKTIYLYLKTTLILL